MLDDLVSIILPVYNCEKYIEKCLQSIIKQDYLKWELIIINDGSSDGTEQICEQYIKSESRIHYFSIQNKGVSNARNCGLANAKGQYVFFVDADDYLEKSCIKNAVKESKYSDSDIVVMAHYEVDEDENVIKANDKFQENEILQNKEVVDSFLLTDKIGWEIWGKLFKRDLLKNITFREDRRIAEDALFLFDALLKSKSISLLKEYGYFYRSNMSSVMAEKFSEKNFDILLSVNEIAEKAKKEKYRGSEAFKIKYYIWFTRRFNKKCSNHDRKTYNNKVESVRKYIASINVKNAYAKLSKKYFIEYFMIRYMYYIYGIAIKIIY